jgi:CheY-like chemotaxis protein
MLKILVIDDAPSEAQALQQILSDHELTVVTDPTRGVADLVEGAWYDIVICDAPALNGYEVFALVQELPDRPAFILISSCEVSCALVADGLLRKPLVASELRDLVATLASKRACAKTRRLEKIAHANDPNAPASSES